MTNFTAFRQHKQVPVIKTSITNCINIPYLMPDFVFKCPSVSKLANVADALWRQCIEAPHDIVFTMRWAYHRRPMKQWCVNVCKVMQTRPETVERKLVLCRTTCAAVDIRRTVCCLHCFNVTLIRLSCTKHFCQSSIVFVPNIAEYYGGSTHAHSINTFT